MKKYVKLTNKSDIKASLWVKWMPAFAGMTDNAGNMKMMDDAENGLYGNSRELRGNYENRKNTI